MTGNILYRCKRKTKHLINLIIRKKKIVNKGSNNQVHLGKFVYYDKLHISITGNNNIISIGTHCKLFNSNSIFIYGDNNVVQIDENVTFDQNVSLVVCEGTKLHIGRDSGCANGVVVRTSDQHPIYDSDGNRINMAKDITIGKHVWLGAHSTIMKGVVIGSNSVIGYGSIVTKDVPDACIVAGIPAKIMKTNIKWDYEMN